MIIPLKKSICLLLVLMVGLGLSACDRDTDKSGKAVEPSSVNSSAALAGDIRGATILVFSKTTGWRHDSIPAGIEALKKMASEQGFNVVASEDAAIFNETELQNFNAIVFLNTTRDILDQDQQFAMERYIQAGGGFVGIHAAADTEWEGDWFWYRKLVGAVFKNHPEQPDNVQLAKVNITDKKHPSTAQLPDSFSLADEWYNYKHFYEFNHVVARVDETTYQGGEHGQDHPIAWYHEYDGGRSFYTGLGHSIAAYSNPDFLNMLLGGMKYVVALNNRSGFKPLLDYSKSRPENNRFIKKTLVENLDEPVKLAFFPNGDALIALRPGTFKRVSYKDAITSDAGKINTAYINFLELGLIGVAVDPEFEKNHWVYAAFTTQDTEGQLYQRLSRFQWRDNQVDSASEQYLLQYPIDQNCCHTGGDLQFGKNGELFWSTGDNSNPHDQDGYAPIDFRPDLAKNDSLRSAGNTMDLRGKVLRIKPLAAGGYDIPAGNLFADVKEGRPEIYVMGARNPYSITYDNHQATLFYGDVGPDASADSDLKGARGYDEINRVTAAGNFGWPLVIGKNHPYKNFDYIKQKSGDAFDVNHLINNSPRNTGAKQLPPAQPAFIAYPYGISDEFPEMGTGGRTALVADVFHANDYPQSQHRYPSYYDNKLFILDFMRTWIKAVSFDEQGRIYKIEPFAPQINYALPIDARFAPDGTLYVLEYGMSWFTGNPDARLARIEYVGAGNRPPLAEITVDKVQSGVPAHFSISAGGSSDLDGDKINYAWVLACADKPCAEKRLGDNKNLTLDLTEAGKYQLQLTVTDVHGEKTLATKELVVGNEPPTIRLTITGNQSFYWPDTKSLDYQFMIEDKEDGLISNTVDAQNPLIQFNYQNAAQGEAQGHQTVSLVDQGKELVNINNCLGCHKVEEKMVGPAFRDVAKKYKNDKKAVNYLVNKIGNGGNGVWGEMSMPAFSGLSADDRKALASYVLSLAEDTHIKNLPIVGQVVVNPHKFTQQLFAREQPFSNTGESYVFTATFTDKGANSIAPIKTTQTITLVPARFELARVFANATNAKDIVQDKFKEKDTIKVNATAEWLGFGIGHYDLKLIKSLKLSGWVSVQKGNWNIEIRRSAFNGPVIATATLEGLEVDKFIRVLLPISPVEASDTLFIAIKSTEKSTSVLQLHDVSFEKE